MDNDEGLCEATNGFLELGALYAKATLDALERVARELQKGMTPKERNPMRLIKPTINLLHFLFHSEKITIDNCGLDKVLETLTEIAKERDEDDPVSRMLMLTVQLARFPVQYRTERYYLDEITQLFI